MFERYGTIWRQTAEIVPSDEASLDFFGYSVSASGGTGIIWAYGEN